MDGKQGGDAPQATPAPAAVRPVPQVHLLNLVNKQDGGPGQSAFRSELIQSEARDTEDVFKKFHDVLSGTNAIIQPPINLHTLEHTANSNNILPALIDAMCTNIDGTGADLELADRDEMEREASEELDDEARAESLKEVTREVERKKAETQEFFDEPWPGESFLRQRKKTRRHQEYTGNAYLEALRNVNDTLVFTRPLDPKTIRIVQLDAPVPVKKKINRAGAELDVTLNMRERRFVQVISGKLVWFKEFGASRDLERSTGRWAEQGVRLPAAERATELIHLKAHEDAETPYGIPRWLSNAPNVLGSRMAEQFNLEFFESGGVPPLLIVVSGGAVAANAEQQLRRSFSSRGPNTHEAAVVEAYATSGDIDSPQNVRVQVERFGSDRQKDSMFEKYITNSDARTRRSFRLSGIFLGETEGFNFATAFASFTVGEAQVFKPEREEFDEIINLKLMPELPNGELFLYRSKPLAVRDATQALVALALVKGEVEPQSFIDAIEEVTGLSLTLPEEKPGAEDEEATPPFGQKPGAQPGQEEEVDDEGKPVKPGNAPQSTPTGTRPRNKSDLALTDRVAAGLHGMAQDVAIQLREGMHDPDGISVLKEVVDMVDTLQPHEQDTFKSLLAIEVYPEFRHDPAGAAELATSCWGLLVREALGGAQGD